MSPFAGPRLLRLYPRAWRQRYGDEFLAIVGDGRLRPQQIIDVVAGAIDAWLSPDVRRAVLPAAVSQRSGGSTMLKATICGRSDVRYTTRDSLIGAGVLIACAILFSLLAGLARRQGWEAGWAILTMMAFPGSLVISMPFTFLKGQPRKAQVVMVAGPLAVLVAIACLSYAI
jgi:hypothetical protein